MERFGSLGGQQSPSFHQPVHGRRAEELGRHVVVKVPSPDGRSDPVRGHHQGRPCSAPVAQLQRGAAVCGGCRAGGCGVSGTGGASGAGGVSGTGAVSGAGGVFVDGDYTHAQVQSPGAGEADED